MYLPIIPQLQNTILQGPGFPSYPKKTFVNDNKSVFFSPYLNPIEP
jgi:hypothetical protein